MTRWHLYSTVFFLIAVLLLLFLVIIPGRPQENIISSPYDTAAINQSNKQVLRLFSEGRLDAADSLANKSLSASLHVDYPAGVAYAYYLLGKISISRFDYPGSMKNFSLAREVYEKLSDSLGIANCILQMGVIAYSDKSMGDANEQFVKALPIYSRLGEKRMAATCRYLSGLSLYELGRYSEAEPALKEAMNIKREIGDLQGIHECMTGLGQLYQKSGRMDSAIFLFRQCESYFDSTGNNTGVIVSWIGIGSVFQLQQNSDSAFAYFRQAYSASREEGFYTGILNSSKSMADLYRQQGDFKNAFIFLSEYYLARDSIYNRDKTRKIVNIQNQLNLTQKQAQIDVLSKQRQIDRFWRIALITGLVLFLISVIMLYQRYSFRKNANKKLLAANNELQDTLENLKATQQQLIQAEKMASLGQLTAGIAHEIRNPVNFINNFSELAREYLIELQDPKLQPEERKVVFEHLSGVLNKIESHGRRANGIVSSMVMHARPSIQEREPTDMYKLIQETIPVSYNAFRTKHNNFECIIEKHLDPSIPELRIVPQDISCVLLNLLTNSFTALYNYKRDKDPSFLPLVRVEAHMNGTHAVISVTDNGPGIPEDIRDRIFDPFFTTLPTGEGTGLGLSICHEIIKAHNGEITFHSEPGVSTSFIIRLPA